MFAKLKKRFQKEDYVKNVEAANKKGLTYIPYLYQPFSPGETHAVLVNDFYQYHHNTTDY
jgi:hypothetical protein